MTKKNDKVEVNEVEISQQIEKDPVYNVELTKKEMITIILSLQHTRDFHKKQIDQLQRSIFSDLEKIHAQNLTDEYQEKLKSHHDNHRAAISAYKAIKKAMDSK